MRFRVEDMSCGHCTAAIEKAVAEAGGKAATDLASHSVTIKGLDSPRRAGDSRRRLYARTRLTAPHPGAAYLAAQLPAARHPWSRPRD